MNSLTSAWVTSHQQTISIIVKDRRPVSNFGKESQIDKKCKHAMRKGFLWHSERVTLNDQANRLHHTSSPTSLVVNLASVIVTVVLPLLILLFYYYYTRFSCVDVSISMGRKRSLPECMLFHPGGCNWPFSATSTSTMLDQGRKP